MFVGILATSRVHAVSCVFMPGPGASGLHRSRCRDDVGTLRTGCIPDAVRTHPVSALEASVRRSRAERGAPKIRVEGVGIVAGNPPGNPAGIVAG